MEFITGVIHFRNQVLCLSLQVKSDHAATKPPLPSLLRDIQTAEGTTAIFPPSVPLYEDGIAASDGVCHVRVGCWRSLYLGCKNKALLRRCVSVRTVLAGGSWAVQV